MTCFWDGILHKTKLKDFQAYGEQKKPRTASQLAEFFRRHNCLTLSVTWNKQKPTEKQLDENYLAIKEYSSRSARNGYFCSTFEPFLFLACQLFHVNVEHSYMGNMLLYEYVGGEDEKNEESNDEKKSVSSWCFCSNGHHFWGVRDRSALEVHQKSSLRYQKRRKKFNEKAKDKNESFQKKTRYRYKKDTSKNQNPKKPRKKKRNRGKNNNRRNNV